MFLIFKFKVKLSEFNCLYNNYFITAQERIVTFGLHLHFAGDI